VLATERWYIMESTIKRGERGWNRKGVTGAQTICLHTPRERALIERVRYGTKREKEFPAKNWNLREEKTRWQHSKQKANSGSRGREKRRAQFGRGLWIP